MNRFCARPRREREKPSTDVILSVEGVRFGYGDGRDVLAGVDLTVRRATLTCLMGVNGCGKSTLLDCVLGERVAWAGSVLVDGFDVRDLRPAQLARLVSYVPQVHERSFPYTVEHVVSMGRTPWTGAGGKLDEEDQAFVERALATCGLDQLATRPYTDLSGGEMQMVMLARALVQDTPLVLMDEPTAHLDFKNELLFLETIEDLVKRENVTVVMATHMPNQAFHLASAGVPTQVALMHEGRVVREGPPRDVLDAAALAHVFGVEAVLMERAHGPTGRPIRQIVPTRTIERAGRGDPSVDDRTENANGCEVG